jgi:hypothetical protein
MSHIIKNIEFIKLMRVIGVIFLLVFRTKAFAFEYVHWDADIPAKILKSKDCNEFFKWQKKTKIHPQWRRCPWMEYTYYRNITIDEILYKIPREMLRGSSQILPDGKDDWIQINFELDSEKAKSQAPNSIIASIVSHKELKNKKFFSREKFIQQYYNFDLHISLEDKNYYFTKVGFDKELGKNIYKLSNHESSYKVYTNDNPENPMDYLVCPTAKGDDSHYKDVCRGAFYYKGMVVTIQVPGVFKNQYLHTKLTLINLLESWEQKQENISLKSKNKQKRTI